METFLSWLGRQAPSIITAAAVVGAMNLCYQIRRDRRQRGAARETAHRLFRPLFEDLELALKSRGARPDGTYYSLGAVASDWFAEIVQLLAQHGAQLPEDERKVLFDARDKVRKLEHGGSIKPEVVNAARDAVAEAVKVLKH
jgi:hypothetical protein